MQLYVIIIKSLSCTFSLEMKGCTIMKNFKRYAAGLAAVMMASSFAACGSSSGTAEDTTTSATTTTGVTVEINTETLASEEQVTMDDVSKLLPDVELENKNIKWFSFYDPFHATTSGNTKALSLIHI